MAYVNLDVQIMDEWDPLFRIKPLKVILLKVSLANSSVFCHLPCERRADWVIIIIVVVYNCISPLHLNDRQILWRWNDNVFFAKQYDTNFFWTNVTDPFWCDYLDFTSVDDVFRCYGFSRIS